MIHLFPQRLEATRRTGRVLGLLVALTLLVTGCGGGGGGGGGGGAGATGSGCTGFCVNANSFLTVAEVQQVIAQAVAEATARGAAATIAVVDRMGNVLAVFRMNGADQSITITSGRSPAVSGGLEGIAVIPDSLAAIAKAITGAYLSTEGNAFTTRTANQIVQEHFNPGEIGQPSGPLFGVQFSQLPCSDLAARLSTELNPRGVRGNITPQRSPLGLSADPGGVPLYKGGTPVGAVGVIADGTYGLDLNIGDTDSDLDELIAVAGTFGFEAPADRRANRITADGKTFRFTDVDFSDLNVTPASAASFASIDGVRGQLVAVPGYTCSATDPCPAIGTIVSGRAFGQPNSGIQADANVTNPNYPGLDAFVLTDRNPVSINFGGNAYPPSPGTDAATLIPTGATPLTDVEVKQILTSALTVANRARAQIRRPVGSQARVTISVVDTNGVILGIVRTRDAPLFGTDVSLQKARTAAFFSGKNAEADLNMVPATVYLNPDASPSGATINISNTYVNAVRVFLGLPTALADGAFAFSDRAGGNMARPYFPDGITVGTSNGPFGKPFAQWSPFTDGLQLDLVMNEIINHVVYILGGGVGVDTGRNCPNTPDTNPAAVVAGRIANGIQIFPGSVPIYDSAGRLLGGIGVSGDGVDQDDMISFLGVHNAGVILRATALGDVGNAPIGKRADQIVIPGQLPPADRLRYIQCPQAPFIDSNQQDPCNGL